MFYRVFLILLFISSCTHLKSRCVEINWYELGRQDSMKGHKWQHAFSERNQYCKFDRNKGYKEAYKNGFDAGLREYCSFKTGYIYGVSKSEDQAQVCPESLRTSFVNGYEAGTYMNEIQNLQSQVQKQLNRLEEKVNNYETKQKVTHSVWPNK